MTAVHQVVINQCESFQNIFSSSADAAESTLNGGENGAAGVNGLGLDEQALYTSINL